MSLRRAARIIALAALAALVSFSILTLGGCAYFKSWQQVPATRDDERTIHVVGHSWHTGIVIAREDLGPLGFVTNHLDGARYEFGWGDKVFYQAPTNTTGLAIKAAFASTGTTVHVVALPESPATYFPESTSLELHISRDGLRTLTEAIAESMALDATGSAAPIRKGLYGNSVFFDGRGRYRLSYTCNTWTADMLERAGVPTTRYFTFTAGSVIRQSKWAAKKYRCCE